MSNAKTQSTKTPTPVQVLSELLDPDMKAVNAIIVNRMQSDVPLIPQLASYLIAAGGKRIRPLLTLAATQLFTQEQNIMTNAHRLAAAVEFIHTATLLHDDVVDESDERRGQEAANLVFGNQASVLVGDFLFSKSFQLMVETDSIRALDVLSNASAVIAEGEVLQLSLMNSAKTTMDDYLRIIEAKTAALFASACEVGPIIAGASKDKQQALADYGLNMGIAFQIADDALDYMAERATLGKAVGDDFREGKLTAPVLLAMTEANDEEESFWIRTMQDKNQTKDDLEQAQSYIKKYDSINQSIKLAESYGEKAKTALKEITESEIKTQLIELVDFSIHRAY